MTGAANPMPDIEPGPGPHPRAVAERVRGRGRRLEQATVAWNCLEATVAIAAGLTAGSRALVAFGLDSCVEVLASVVVLLDLRRRATREAPGSSRASRLVAAAFLVLGIGLLAEAIRSAAADTRQHLSVVGMALTAATVAVMWLLAFGKRRAGRALGNRAMELNARMTFLDGCLALGVLVGLVASSVVGWRWADQLVAAGVGVVLVVQGVREWTLEEAPHD
jgi:divalent metal cation (Fe/Co/Zn/Cd) transporter